MFTPTNQVRLTNIAVVRVRRGKQRFEIACYPNKVTAWRRGLEKDLDEVLQAHTVFTNVSKGAVARAEDLQRAFGTADHAAVCVAILEKGELQVNERERQLQLEALLKDIATVVSEKCVNPQTKRPYTVGMIERAMRDAHFSANTTHSAKQQALDVIRLLQASIPIQRAQMRMRLVLPRSGAKELRDALVASKLLVEVLDDGQWTSDALIVECLIDPGSFRALTDKVASSTKGKGRIDVLELAVVDKGDGGLLDGDAPPPADAAASSSGGAADSSDTGLLQVVNPDGTITYLGV